MNEAEVKAYVDRVVMRRLGTDAAYLNAENAEQQAEREAEIEREVYLDVVERLSRD
jgi:hypothetical protein